MADGLLKSCNLELVVRGDSLEAASESLLALHLMLYVNSVHPFAAQMITSHSVNDYSDICARKTPHAVKLLPPEHRRGVISSEVDIHVWRCPYPSGSHFRSELLSRELSTATFSKASEDAGRWLELRRE